MAAASERAAYFFGTDSLECPYLTAGTRRRKLSAARG
jgi:hypothetical protein